MVAAAPRAAASPWGFLPIAAAFALLLLAVSPAGEFPLNDDWLYHSAVKQRLETGADHIERDTSAFLYPQRSYGAVLARAFGFSFGMLRLTGLLAGFVSLLLAYRLLGRLGLSTFACFAGTAALLVNPLFVNVSYSFMSDVPYLAFMLGALLLYVRVAQGAGRADLAAATALALLATFQRQTGVLLGSAVFLYFFISRRRLELRAIDWLLLLAPLLAFGGYTVAQVLRAAAPEGLLQLLDPKQWLYLYHLNAPSDFAWMTPEARADFRAIILLSIPAYLGLFLLPLILGGLARFGRARRNLPAALLPTAAVALAALYLLRYALVDSPVQAIQARTMPFLTNIWAPCGLGAGPGQVIVGECTPIFPPALHSAITLASLAGGALLIAFGAVWIVRRAGEFHWRSLTVAGPAAGETDGAPAGLGLVILAGALQVAPFFVAWPMDRYLIPLIVPGAALILVSLRRVGLSRIVVCIALLPLAYFSAAGAHDYLSWNRARWTLAAGLLEQGVSPARIEGGLEWVGYMLYFKTPYRATVPLQHPSFLWYARYAPQLDPEYVIAFNEIPGYRVAETLDYDAWLPAASHSVHLLQRIAK